jgi:hypothetical protein
MVPVEQCKPFAYRNKSYRVPAVAPAFDLALELADGPALVLEDGIGVNEEETGGVEEGVLEGGKEAVEGVGGVDSG